jgi:DNA-3-methyladenine glycosylase
MRERRPGVSDHLLCAGPGRLTAALGVDESLNAGSAVGAESRVTVIGRTEEPEISRGPRIGISRATQKPWRFGLARSPFLSRSFPSR